MSTEFTESEKGRKTLVDNGHRYHKSGENSERVYWKSGKISKTKCRPCIITVKDEIVKSSNDHNDILDAADIAAKEAVSKPRQLAKLTQDAPDAAVSSVLDDCYQSLATKLPKMQRPVEKSILVFATIRNLECLSLSSHW
ncbi:Hypothetical predicted protein [Octopus vulgaris]|uniref:FLYWCH-type domain-containing protein n=1 Tax=Octopus vulgaris TaxID=6645 RepID=A0AA36BL07_OCTVU|nr:Hypothetical predicted protein [Octopus vulgaris]